MTKGRISIYPRNPRYWQIDGRPTVLIGGSVEDNLFQIPNLREHLDLLQSVGGNYVRCTMSCRDEGDVWPFAKPDKLYDLDRWNPEFWRRFAHFLELTSERGIVAQIELWATFDYYRENWDVNPFNPKNNLTYTAQEAGLPLTVNSHPVRTENNFFWSVPQERDQEIVLAYQERFVAEILRHSLPYGNVLYCIDNETSVTAAWGAYWSEFSKSEAAEAGVSVETTEMWDAHDLFHQQHKATLDHRETYSFADVSQNNHQIGQAHWDNAQLIRRSIDPIRPLNNVKIYGADTGRYGNDVDAQQRFWRNLLGGMASARFHRPPAGLGLCPIVQANLRSARSLLDSMEIWRCEPRHDLLRGRSDNGAYCAAEPGKRYAVYFPTGQRAELDLSAVDGGIRAMWLEVSSSAWQRQEELGGGAWVDLIPPTESQWVALIEPKALVR